MKKEQQTNKKKKKTEKMNNIPIYIISISDMR